MLLSFREGCVETRPDPGVGTGIQQEPPGEIINPQIHLHRVPAAEFGSYELPITAPSCQQFGASLPGTESVLCIRREDVAKPQRSISAKTLERVPATDGISNQQRRGVLQSKVEQHRWSSSPVVIPVYPGAQEPTGGARDDETTHAEWCTTPFTSKEVATARGSDHKSEGPVHERTAKHRQLLDGRYLSCPPVPSPLRLGCRTR